VVTNAYLYVLKFACGFKVLIKNPAKLLLFPLLFIITYTGKTIGTIPLLFLIKVKKQKAPSVKSSSKIAILAVKSYSIFYR